MYGESHFSAILVSLDSKQSFIQGPIIHAGLILCGVSYNSVCGKTYNTMLLQNKITQ